MSSHYRTIGILTLSVFIMTTMNFCRADSQFSSDMESIGLMIGLNQLGEGCAEIGKITGSPNTYRTDIRAVPNRICDTYQQPTYSEYIEVMRAQLKLMSRSIQRYNTPNCSPYVTEVLDSINDPALNPLIINTNAIIQPMGIIQYIDYRWLPINNSLSELNARFTDPVGWNDSLYLFSVARMAHFNEYINFMIGELIRERSNYVADANCSNDIALIRGWAHPGWRYLMTDKDLINPNAPPVMMVGRCSYNGGSPACATNIGPLF